jgi:hypothetical protein
MFCFCIYVLDKDLLTLSVKTSAQLWEEINQDESTSNPLPLPNRSENKKRKLQQFGNLDIHYDKYKNSKLNTYEISSIYEYPVWR